MLTRQDRRDIERLIDFFRDEVQAMDDQYTVQRLLAEHDRLHAEVARLKPDAVIGAAVRRLGPETWLAHCAKGSVVDSPQQWRIDSGDGYPIASGDTLEAALAAAGLLP